MKQKLFELNYFIQWNQCFEILQTSKNLLNKMKSSYQENSDQEDNLGVNIGEQVKLSKNKRKKQRLRSRNNIIDEWLEDEDGQDAYADLEDFLVT
mmetsp:Transcript_10058/g.10537  ORF Transcript_10058/g.10537 Transcript_10058/m.10537 type:complete len:95 (+) Transcript_10058:2-286(+)